VSTTSDRPESSGAQAGTSWTGNDPRTDPLLDIGERAVDLVEVWLHKAERAVSRSELSSADRLSGLVGDRDGFRFAMRFVDRVMRPESHRAAARQLAHLVKARRLPGFLSAADRLLLRAGGRLAPILPGVVMPLAARRMRGLVGHLVVNADSDVLAAHLAARRDDGFRLNLNLLGEAVLGEAEADRRHRELLRMLDQPDVDYVSVKVSAVASQLNYWDFEGSLQRVVERLRPLLAKAASTRPVTFVNLDMEEYHDLELTMSAFMAVLDEPGLHALDAGIVLQAYLPDSFTALQTLVEWATGRRNRVVDGNPGGIVKIRLVKGANLAMERVDAALHGWEQAPYLHKAETDANYKRCLDWLLTPERTEAVRVGIGSHNLFEVAFALLLAADRGVLDSVECEMLEGMAPAHARVVQSEAGRLLLYTPAVAAADFDVAISYLFRRLEENATDENFIHRLFGMAPGSPSMQLEAERFRASLRDRRSVSAEPRRTQQRDGENRSADEPFANEPDTDPALPVNRAWARDVIQSQPTALRAPLTEDTDVIDSVLAAAAGGATAWRNRRAGERRQVLRAVADELARRRSDLIAAMIHEADKTFAEADPEVSEAIDFARYYGDRALELEWVAGARFVPLGVVAVVPPWNFPVAIPAGGVTAALAAGNAVVLKPAPETPRCAEIVAECCWAAGVGQDALQYVRVPDNDVGRHLVTHPEVGGVVLTGGFETAELFRSWRPDLRLFAETSGKNALVITPNADIDLAVADLVASAFGHSGQKCSAASLAICVGEVYDSPRLRRQLTDAVGSLEVGPAGNLATRMGPTIAEPAGKLLHGLTLLDEGEEWLLEPRRVAPATWTPGIRAGVRPGSWFHQTECFGPVLGLVRADSLAEAVDLQNATLYGLTGGIHSLDDDEVAYWLEHVEVGNAYVNRPITGAIVQRQPFGGWKRSAVGPGAKAGGPNYVAQFGTWHPTDADVDNESWLAGAQESDRIAWNTEFSQEHDPTGLYCESNVLRYRPLRRLAVRVEGDRRHVEIDRVLDAARLCGVEVTLSDSAAESAEEFAARLGELDVARVRVLGPVALELRTVARTVGVHLANEPVTSVGRIELLHYLREQTVSRTTHRYGNLL
jgi:RHH-type proline utilization regulon transcriptional repressor/proline dehydrogenase/delta 1-pyrroline-5-carboxylate dehydrogenase